MEFKEALKKARKIKGMLQEDLAKKLAVTQATISSWEIGRTEPTLMQVVQLSKILGISVNVLLGEDEVVKVKKPSTVKVSFKIKQEIIDATTDRGDVKVITAGRAIANSILKDYSKWVEDVQVELIKE